MSTNTLEQSDRVGQKFFYSRYTTRKSQNKTTPRWLELLTLPLYSRWSFCLVDRALILAASKGGRA